MTNPLFSRPLRIGSRTSKMALRQAQILRDALASVVPEWRAPDAIELVSMKSSGDWKPGQKELSFAAMGANKGLFAKELEEALLAEDIDIAIHSAKDLETHLPEQLELAAFLPRDDVRDAFISRHADHPRHLPPGASVGTSSLRRAAQILHIRPDLVIAPFRGNADTRLRKLDDGQVDAALLAAAGLERLGVAGAHIHTLTVGDMLPAAAQGALAIEMRCEDDDLRALVRRVNCAATEQCVSIEREFLRHIDGSCHTPVAALATRRDDGQIDFTALVATPDGKMLERRHEVLTADAAMARAGELGRELRRLLPCDLLSA